MILLSLASSVSFLEAIMKISFGFVKLPELLVCSEASLAACFRSLNLGCQLSKELPVAGSVVHGCI